MSELQIPSLYNLRCPSCGTSELKVLGQKGAASKSIAMGIAFGAIGSLITNASIKKSEATKPLHYKCKQCCKKFETFPLPAEADELLSAPCRITFQRLKSIMGMSIQYIVYLNGMRVGPIKNGKTFTFETNIKNNTIFVTDFNGVAFADEYNFEATDNGLVVVNFKRKFIK